MNTPDVAKVLPPSAVKGNRNPLKIDGELTGDGMCPSTAIPFKGENAELFLNLLNAPRANPRDRMGNRAGRLVDTLPQRPPAAAIRKATEGQ